MEHRNCCQKVLKQKDTFYMHHFHSVQQCGETTWVATRLKARAVLQKMGTNRWLTAMLGVPNPGREAVT